MSMFGLVRNPKEGQVGVLDRSPQRDYQVILLLVAVLLSAFSVLMGMVHWYLLSQAANKQAPVLVELQNGQPVRVGPIDHNDRSAETIRRFTASTLTMLMGWSGFLPPENEGEIRSPRPDPGVEIEGGKYKVTTATFQAGFALSEDFRGEFLRKIAQLTPSEILTSRTMQTALVILHTSDPIAVEEGKWKVRMVANLISLRKGDTGKVIPFNKEVFIKAVDAPGQLELENANALEKTIYGVRQSGLEIYAVRDLERENL